MSLKHILPCNLYYKLIAINNEYEKLSFIDKFTAIKKLAVRLSRIHLFPEVKLKILEDAIIRTNIPDLKFRSLRGKLPEAFFLSAMAVYRYCLESENYDITIVRPGNGGGRDLFIQQRYLEALGINPRYILIDRSEEQNILSQRLNPDIPASSYFTQDLFNPLLQEIIQHIGENGVDIVDFQQVLHEIRSEGCGGSYMNLQNVVQRFSDILVQGGLVIGEDVNIVEEGYDRDVEFALSEEYIPMFEQFCRFLKIQDAVKKMGHNKYSCPLRWFSVLCGKLHDFNQTDREMREIHKNMTVRDWEALFQRSGLTILCITPLGVPAIILEALKRNITMLSRADWPPFSVYFVAQKPK